MTPQEIKDLLFANPDFILDILGSLGCHSLSHIPNARVIGALPDGDNPTSIQVLLDNSALVSVIHTRVEYDGSDFFDLVAYLLETNFMGAIKYVTNCLGIDYDLNIEKQTNETYNMLNKFAQNCPKCTKKGNDILDEKVLSNYACMPHELFVKDNITVDAQVFFGIHYDVIKERILIPIRDIEGNLVTIKGRTINPVDKHNPKYIAYYPYNATDILYGYWENLPYIKEKKEVIVVEGEKSVMQGYGYGWHNIVALSKKKISEEQLKQLIRLNVDVVLALDNDVPAEEIQMIAKQFLGLCNVYAVYPQGVLEGKNSPFDEGKEKWEKLYDNKVRLN